MTVPREHPVEPDPRSGTTPSPAVPPDTGAIPTVRDLRLVAVSPERSHLVLEDSGGQQFRVPIDQRLVAVLRSVPASGTRHAQLEIPMESALSPREIQARIRAGAAVDEVARLAGISEDRVERYAVPVMAERVHIVEVAQKGAGRRASGGRSPSLLELVAARAAEQGLSSDAIEWDAWRPDDAASWTVQVSYLAGDRARTATWSFDPRGRVLAPVDDEARWLVDEPGSPRSADPAPPAVRRLSAVPVPDEVYDREAERRPHSDADVEVTVAAPTTGSPTRAAKRPSVPSWDDIMFGPRKRD